MRTFLFFLGFVLGFFLLPDKDSVLLVKESWLWNKAGMFSTKIPSGIENPLQTLNGYLLKDQKFYSFSQGKTYLRSENKKLEFPLFASGRLEYEKIGDEVHYFSDSGELFWKKPLNSYPRAGFYSSPVLYLAGDNNTVFLLDQSGNPTGVGQVDGRFLADFQFDSLGNGAGILFLGGEYYRLDAQGKILFSLEGSKERSFHKSLALSPNGTMSLLHVSIQGKDSLQLFGNKQEVFETWELPLEYPHVLSMAVSDFGEVLINAPNKAYFGKKGKWIFTWEKSETGGVYQPVLCFGAGFVLEMNNQIWILDRDGHPLKTKSIQKLEKSLRFFQGKNREVFYLENAMDIYQFKIL